MVLRRSGRRIPSKTARAMLGWAHYCYRMRLLNKAREYPHCRVEIVDEHYTSKTCGRCGRIHQKLGGKKAFRCPRCRLEADRDIHAARNVLLCFLARQDIIVAKGRELPECIHPLWCISARFAKCKFNVGVSKYPSENLSS